jgi:hypothetical protein
MGVPVVNLFYEGTGGMNQQLGVFLANHDPGGARSGPPGRANGHVTRPR